MENTSQTEKETTNESVSPENQTEATTTNPAAESEAAEKAKLQDELTASKDKYLRLYAEFENHRRRTAKEKLDMVQSANEQLVKALLPVVDDFERAEKSLKETSDKNVADGVLLIYQKLKRVLEQQGVKAMDAGGDFNPDLHEAITQVPAPDESKKGKIIDVVEKGYLLNDKVIRFAKVVVGS